MSVTVTPSQLQALLAASIRMRDPLGIKGVPGIGKTAIVEQVTERLGYTLIKSHPALDDPTDGKGLPWFNGKGKAELVPFGQLARVLEATTPTVWLLDDFGQAPDAVQKTYMQWLHGGECAGHKIPRCVSIVLNTNDRTHRAGVGGLLEPVKSRVTIVELTANLDEWCGWLFEQTEIDGVPVDLDLIAETVAFLRMMPDLFCKFEPSADLTNSPLPRGWARTLKWFTAKLDPQSELAAISGAVGEGAALQRIGFRKLYAEMPTIDQILLDPDKAKLPTKPSIHYAVARGLAMRATPKTFGRIARYAQRLLTAGHGEFATLLIRESTRRDESLMQTPEFVRLNTGEMGQLIGSGVK